MSANYVEFVTKGTEAAATDLLDLICGSVLPDKVQQPVVAVRKDYCAFSRAGFHSIRPFVSEGTAGFEREQIFGHVDGSWGERVTSSALMQGRPMDRSHAHPHDQPT